MTRKIPLFLTLATLVGFAAPALAAGHAAGHDPQAATTTAKHHPTHAKHAKAKAKAVKGRHHAKARAGKRTTEKKAATPAAEPAAR